MEKKDPKKARQLNYFFGAGDFYLGNFDFGLINLGTWPFSMFWAPEGGANRALLKNWYETKRSIADKSIDIETPAVSEGESEEPTPEQLPIFDRLSIALNDPNAIERRQKGILEVSLIPIDSFTPLLIGKRGVVYFKGRHGLLFEESNKPEIFDIFTWMSKLLFSVGPEEDHESSSSSHRYLAYRYFYLENWFFQLGYKERKVSYYYEACLEGSCMRTIDSTSWEAKQKLAVVTVGYQTFIGTKANWVAGGEANFNFSQKKEFLRNTYTRDRAGDSPTLSKSQEAMKRLLASQSLDILVHIGYLF